MRTRTPENPGSTSSLSPSNGAPASRKQASGTPGTSKLATLGDLLGGELRTRLLRSLPAVAAAAPDALGAQLAAARATCEADIVQLRGQAWQAREELARLEARARELTVAAESFDADTTVRSTRAAEEQACTVRAHLDGNRVGFQRSLESRERSQLDVSRVRAAAVVSVGRARVDEYEETRRRLRTPRPYDDSVARAAYEILEQRRRGDVPALAAALDELHPAATPSARFVAFSTEDCLILVAPLAAGLAVDRPCVPSSLACAFWETAERATRELAHGGVLDDGAVSSCLAARLPGISEPALLEVLLHEAVRRRGSLCSVAVEVRFELVERVAVEYIAAAPDAAATPLGGEPTGGPLPDVARRLGLSVRDLIAALHEHGLPFPDDLLEAGTERTLRALLDETTTTASAAVSVALPSRSPAEAAPQQPTIAARILARMLRDRRIGGRHTQLDNTCAHHFSDEEKHLARRVAEWMVKDGLLLPKTNEGSHHVSINPRRLRDVGAIVRGTWTRRNEIEGQ